MVLGVDCVGNQGLSALFYSKNVSEGASGKK